MKVHALDQGQALSNQGKEREGERDSEMGR